jgi:hypothetical protein
MRLTRAWHSGNAKTTAVIAEDVLLGGSRGESHFLLTAKHAKILFLNR